MYFDSESQEQVFKIISQSMKESEVGSVLSAEAFHVGLTCIPVLSPVPKGL